MHLAGDSADRGPEHTSDIEARAVQLTGTWHLVAWRRIGPDGARIFPLGRNAEGTLVYAPDGGMAVVLTGVPRGLTDTPDPLGGDVQKRADAYSTCLAYAGTYHVDGGTVVHHVTQCLFPGWANTEQARQIAFDENDNLVLRTPPQPPHSASPTGGTVNEIVWSRQPRS